MGGACQAHIPCSPGPIMWWCLSSLYRVLQGPSCGGACQASTLFSRAHRVVVLVKPLPCSSGPIMWWCLSSLYLVLQGPSCGGACQASTVFFRAHHVVVLVKPLTCSPGPITWWCLSSLYRVLQGTSCGGACQASNVFSRAHHVVVICQLLLVPYLLDSSQTCSCNHSYTVFLPTCTLCHDTDTVTFPCLD